MPLIPRAYRITVYNRANEEVVGEYFANDPPRVGDLLSLTSIHTMEGDPFHHWNLWRIDSIIWTVSASHSLDASELSRETGGQIADTAFCWRIEVTVWPERGPHWVKTPDWVKRLRSAAYQDEEE